MADAQQNVLQEYYDRFQAYVQSKSNSVFARYRLHSKIQEPGETVQQFVTALKLLVKDWRSHCARHNRVWHKIRQKVREKLIDTGSDLTLERATEVARVDEVSVQRLKEMKDETDKVYMQWRRRTGDTKTQSPMQLHIHVVDVVGNMVMLPEWVKSAGSVK